MRFSALQAKLWHQANKLNEENPIGSTVNVEGEEYEVLYDFSVISTTVVAHLLRKKTNRQVQMKVAINASKENITEEEALQRVESS